MGARSLKQRRSQPASGGSSLCCAGQRRRHAEHDCYSTTGTDAAITAAYYTSAQVDALLGNYRTGDQRHHRRTAGLLHLGAGRRAVGITARQARRTRRRRPPSRARCWPTGRARTRRVTTNQITSALAAYRSAADQDTATASSIAAAAAAAQLQPTDFSVKLLSSATGLGSGTSCWLTS